ncbi:MAG TPA: hypothetical protein VHS96_07500 [Bacteroidia bacterium]|nr:hypothetical protein [Bacteroidia bacterium]
MLSTELPMLFAKPSQLDPELTHSKTKPTSFQVELTLFSPRMPIFFGESALIETEPTLFQTRMPMLLGEPTFDFSSMVQVKTRLPMFWDRLVQFWDGLVQFLGWVGRFIECLSATLPVENVRPCCCVPRSGGVDCVGGHRFYQRLTPLPRAAKRWSRPRKGQTLIEGPILTTPAPCGTQQRGRTIQKIDLNKIFWESSR